HPTPELAAKLKNDDAVWGYHLGDEPYPESTFQPLSDQLKVLRKADPNHLSFINMLSTTGDFLRAYMDIVEPELLSYDYYQWRWGSDRYFEKLEQFREEALKADVPLACCIESTADPRYGEGHSGNAEKLHQSVYTCLAYGVKGVEWFHCDGIFKKGTVELTRSGQDIVQLNAEMKCLGPTLMRLRSVDVYHTEPLPLGTRSTPKEHWIHLIGEEATAGLVLGMFKDDSETNYLDDADIDYFMVTNRDYRHAQNVVIRFQSKWLGIAPWHAQKKEKRTVERFDKLTGEWAKISSSAAVGFVYFIEPGDGELFKVTTTITMTDETRQ
ncbi:MAG: hypothetical protein JXB48_06880, partial [Candidatus Latescibacteria bacterium]|nr:hypothetical protein [Candidatus Latescibacterota bacterium]